MLATDKRNNSNNNRAMMGTLTSVAFLAICLTVTNAFMVWAPTVTSSDPAYGRQASSLLIGAPLGGTGRRVGAGGSLSQTDGNDAAEAKKICRPRLPTARDYTASRRSICALHAFKGPEVRAYLTLPPTFPSHLQA